MRRAALPSSVRSKSWCKDVGATGYIGTAGASRVVAARVVDDHDAVHERRHAREGPLDVTRFVEGRHHHGHSDAAIHGYSTVTVFARLRGWSTSVPLKSAT